MISKLRVQNFRSHIDYEVNLANGITIITGPNGCGKTSLLEAIYLSLVGKSWRSTFSEIVRHDEIGQIASWWRVDFCGDPLVPDRVVKFIDGQKLFEVNGQTYKRLPATYKLPVVLFEPNDIQLLYGSPTRRRDFFDRFITQLEPEHQTDLNKFERVLRQRNNLLKQQALPDELFVWDVQFSSLSERISHRRRDFVSTIITRLNDKYSEIAGRDDVIRLKFVPGAPASAHEIMQRLAATYGMPMTTLGAQKDDYKFTFNGKEAKTSASRGENRTILFALLGVIADIVRQRKGNAYVLLDDIDSELDQSHRNNLYAMSSFQLNTIATTLSYSGTMGHHVQLQ